MEIDAESNVAVSDIWSERTVILHTSGFMVTMSWIA